jgi:hypothetical protein
MKKFIFINILFYISNIFFNINIEAKDINVYCSYSNSLINFKTQAYDEPDSSLLIMKLQFLENEITGYNQLFTDSTLEKYFMNIFFSCYNKIITTEYDNRNEAFTEKKIKIDSFFEWLKENPNLLELFKLECWNGNIKFIDCNNSSLNKKSSLSIFSFWLGTKYVESWYSKIFKNDTRIGKICIKEMESGVPIMIFGKIKTSLMIKDDDVNMIIHSIDLGIHERAHWLNGSTNEAAACIAQNLLSLPLQITNACDSCKDEKRLLYLSGRRNFYDKYMKTKSNYLNQNDIEILSEEYLEFVLYPWLTKYIDINKISKMKNPPDSEVWSLSDLLNKCKNFKSVEIAKDFCNRYAIDNKNVQTKLTTVLDSLKKNFSQPKKINNIWDFINKYIELMNMYFSKPILELWDEYTFYESKNKKIKYI